MIKKIDFRKISVLKIDGTKEQMDLSKPVGNLIFEQTGDIGEMDLAKKIYYEGEVALQSQQLESIRLIISQAQIKAYLKVPLLEALKTQGHGTNR
ncbi:hypothetical protein [Bacteroides caecimuris]|uniref:hypothetical protein n=1 Tax=Bacteroides caecimuris TaxID=1796613 RepID=UPI0024324C5E|nr:hypothetical protein [Bacteroides caecimuris]